MAMQVCSGAQMSCSMGLSPSSFNATPKVVTAGARPPGNVMDHVPILNIAPFGMCQSLANPVVASATASAGGTLTPMPCIPATTAPWAPGSAPVQLAGAPALSSDSTLACLWAGVIQITDPGQTVVQVA